MFIKDIRYALNSSGLTEIKINEINDGRIWWSKLLIRWKIEIIYDNGKLEWNLKEEIL